MTTQLGALPIYAFCKDGLCVPDLLIQPLRESSVAANLFRLSSDAGETV
jgi:hypothetical protein